MDLFRERALLATRRHFLGRSAVGIGTAALSTLLGGGPLSASQDPARGAPHFRAKAKRVIYLFQNGAPTHVDLWKR